MWNFHVFHYGVGSWQTLDLRSIGLSEKHYSMFAHSVSAKEKSCITINQFYALLFQSLMVKASFRLNSETLFDQSGKI
jgi:hypothetical protein